jgi:hypothetical protein
MLTKAFPSGRPAALLLVLLVLAAIVTGVAASATKTVVPKQLTGKWERGPQRMVIGPRGEVEIRAGRRYHARFSHVTAHEKHGWDEWVGRLTISGMRSCSGTGTYRLTIGRQAMGAPGWGLSFTEIHDPCKPRVNLLGIAPPDDPWVRHTSQP